MATSVKGTLMATIKLPFDYFSAAFQLILMWQVIEFYSYGLSIGQLYQLAKACTTFRSTNLPNVRP